MTTRKEITTMLIQFYEGIAKLIFLFITLVMSFIPVALTITAIWSVLTPALRGEPLLHALLRGIGYLIVAVAVFDVAKFLLEEEIIRSSELRSSVEARQSLTKFMTIMIIAFSLEALVIVFESQEAQQTDLLGPVLLFGAATLAMIGLSIFQWLSRQAEERDPPVKDTEEVMQEKTDKP